MSEEYAMAFEVCVLQNGSIRAVWNAWEDLDLPDCWLVAGCLAQTIWNTRFGFSPEYGVSDIDIVYFDPDDLKEESEQKQAKRIRQLFKGLPIRIDVKNEARVHLWYGTKFGNPIPPYASVKEAIDTFPTTSTAVGMRPGRHGTEVYAAFGFVDLFDGVLRANKRQITRDIYRAKVSKWIARWPELKVLSWDQS